MYLFYLRIVIVYLKYDTNLYLSDEKNTLLTDKFRKTICKQLPYCTADGNEGF